MTIIDGKIISAQVKQELKIEVEKQKATCFTAEFYTN